MRIEFTRHPATRLYKAAALTAMMGVTALSHAADPDTGKVLVNQMCAECHRVSDWSGETSAALQSLMSDIVAGKVKHSQRPFKLTPQQIADIAEFWTSGRK